MNPGDQIASKGSALLGEPGTTTLALLSLVDVSERGHLPAEELRVAVSDAWHGRGFDVLDPAQTDAAAAGIAHAREISIPGVAVAELQFLSWNDRLLVSHGQLEMDVALTVYSATGDAVLRDRMAFATCIGAMEVRGLEPEVVEAMIIERVAKYLGHALPAKWL